MEVTSFEGFGRLFLVAAAAGVAIVLVDIYILPMLGITQFA